MVRSISVSGLPFNWSGRDAPKPARRGEGRPSNCFEKESDGSESHPYLVDVKTEPLQTVVTSR